jgi:hypothetical protein
MTVIIPSSYKNFGVGEEYIDTLQLNTSTVLGDFVGTFNCDLYTNKGKIRVAPRGMFNTTTDDIPVAIKPCLLSGGATWGISAGRYVYFNSSDNPSATFTQDATASSPTDGSPLYSDMETFNGYLYVTGSGTFVNKFSGTAWTTVSAGTSSNPHLLCVFNNRMYMSTTNYNVISWDINDSVATIGSQNTISIKSANVFNSTITFLRVAQNRIFIGTMSNIGGHGYVYVWDGVSPTTFDKQIELKSNGALSCVVMNDIPYIMDARGFLMEYNGANFVEVARLPLYNKRLLTGSTAFNNGRWIHPNGMAVSWDKINILINNAVDLGIEPYCPSGVWEYDPSVGLYHKTSSTNTSVATTTINDYGQVYVNGVGALVDASIYSGQSTYAGTLLWGCNTTFGTGVFTNDSTNTTQKWGYIVSPEMYSQNIESMWGMIYARYRKLLDSADEIIVKYRSIIDIPTEQSITWINTSSFTAGSSVLSAGYAIGDEVEIVEGYGGGKSAHITSISANGLTIGLDDTFTGVATNTATARFTHWVKLGIITPTTTLKPQFSKFSFPINNNDTKIQIKVCMQFLGNDELEQIQIVEKPEVEAT